MSDGTSTASTGINGLDVILGGGLPSERLYLVEGTPGTGKTTLGLGFLLAGAERGEKGLYITLSETEDELLAVAKTHGWSLDAIEIFEMVPEVGFSEDQEQSLLHPSEVELGETVRSVIARIEESKPARVVLDSLSELRLLAQSSIRYRRQILALKHFFTKRQCTVLVLDDKSDEAGDLQLHSIAHGVISLEQTLSGFGAQRRRLHVVKMRGVRYSGGYHDFDIVPGGLSVYPRLIAADHPGSYDDALVSTGSAAFDTLLGGGLARGTATLLSGPAGIGKTTTSVQSMVAALERGEKAAYFLFDERLPTLLKRSRSLGMDIQPFIDSGQLTIRAIDPAELSPGEFAGTVRKSVEEDGAATIVIDSLNAYLLSMPDGQFLVLQMHELLTYLGQQGVVSLLILGQHGVMGDIRSDVDLSYLADTVVQLRFFEAHGEVRQAISVIKTRTSRHERTIREFRIGDQGLVLGEPLRDFYGVLSGVPKYAGEDRALMADASGRGSGTDPLMEYRVLILAPRGRDAAVARDLLQRSGIAAEICTDLPSLAAKMKDGAGAVLITEEAFAAGDRTELTAFVAGQPKWSDLPFVILGNGTKGPRSPLATGRLEELSNIILLERPLHAEAMVGAIESALRARRRQYELRDVAVTLERAVAERTQELAYARDGLEIALEAAGMGSWDVDLKTGDTRRTHRHDEIFGYAELESHWSIDRFLAHVTPAERPAIATAFAEAITSGTLDIECSIQTRDGFARWIVAKGRVRYDADGAPSRMSGVVSDVTDRREADEKLAQAQKMDAIGQLTGGVAHDFNNLLTPIVGGLDLLRKRHADDERSQKLIGGALQAAERAATLTQRLLAFARRQSLQPQAVDIGGLMDGISDLIRRSLGPTIAVTVEVPPHLPSARVDPNQLELALLNLAINARDAMSGGGRLTIAISNVAVAKGDALELQPGSYIRIAATDTGVGMDRATLARAAEPFFSTKGVGKGTGLGLSMVHGLAAQSGGTLQIHSQPGKGTTIEIWLPATDDKTETGPASAADQPLARRSARILLIDDEDIVRTATADMLRDVGYDVIEFGSASQALAAVRAGLEADLLISDYLMPGMTGAVLIRELRARADRMPALLITGYANAGADVPTDLPLLSKPFKQVDLVHRIDELLRPRAGTAPRLRAVE